MKVASFDFSYEGGEFLAFVNISDIKIPHSYSISLKNKNSDENVTINLHDYCEGLGIESGKDNHDQNLRDQLAATLNYLILENKLIIAED